MPNVKGAAIAEEASEDGDEEPKNAAKGRRAAKKPEPLADPQSAAGKGKVAAAAAKAEAKAEAKAKANAAARATAEAARVAAAATPSKAKAKAKAKAGSASGEPAMPAEGGRAELLGCTVRLVGSKWVVRVPAARAKNGKEFVVDRVLGKDKAAGS